MREQRLPGLTQPRIGKAAGVLQSHLTYHFATRADLLDAVLERAAAGQRTGVDATLAAANEASLRSPASSRGNGRGQRTLGSSSLSPSQLIAIRPPEARYSARAQGMRGTVAEMLTKMDIAPCPETVAMVHALGTGLAILALALGKNDTRRGTEVTLAVLFLLLAEHQPVDADTPGGSSWLPGSTT